MNNKTKEKIQEIENEIADWKKGRESLAVHLRKKLLKLFQAQERETIKEIGLENLDFEIYKSKWKAEILEKIGDMKKGKPYLNYFKLIILPQEVSDGIKIGYNQALKDIKKLLK